MVATQDLSKSRQKNHALPSRGFRLRPHRWCALHLHRGFGRGLRAILKPTAISV